MVKPRDAPLSRRRAGRERLAATLCSPVLRIVFVIWPVRHGAAAPPHVACTTSPHPTPIASHGSSGMPAPQRVNPTAEVPSAACDRVMDIHAVPMPTHPFHINLVRAHAPSYHDRSQSAEKVVDQEWRRTSISSAWARLLDILFVGGHEDLHEVISPVRCAPPSPTLTSEIVRFSRKIAKSKKLF